MIAIVDYEMGNIKSLQNALDFLGIESCLTRNPKHILNADKIILPGVGTFDLAMKNLKTFKLLDVLNNAVLAKKKKILGICLGMQILSTVGEENGPTNGLGWIEGVVSKLKIKDKQFKLPHIGFNSINITNKENPLFTNLHDGVNFYFVHSYVITCLHENNVTAYTNYGGDFVSCVNKDNIYGTQFHPEKSQSNGLILLKNFISL